MKLKHSTLTLNLNNLIYNIFNHCAIIFINVAKKGRHAGLPLQYVCCSCRGEPKCSPLCVRPYIAILNAGTNLTFFNEAAVAQTLGS